MIGVRDTSTPDEASGTADEKATSFEETRESPVVKLEETISARIGCASDEKTCEVVDEAHNTVLEKQTDRSRWRRQNERNIRDRGCATYEQFAGRGRYS